MPSPAVNPARLNRALQELGRFGETPQGMQRLAFSPASRRRASREYTIYLTHRPVCKPEMLAFHTTERWG